MPSPRLVFAALLAAASFVQATPAPGDGAPANARVHFIGIKDGDVLPPTVTLRFGVEGMKVRSAAEDPFDRSSGHHHLLIDLPAVPKGQVIPFDERHVHYGKGQTEATVTLAPGPHTLTLQFADGAHGSYGPQLSASVRVTVEAAKPAETDKKPAKAGAK
ncbi:DUF4399 domain-containing protein [Chitinimonas koreensis]|uniref:DUF4399 domain-containing protein n=1 Tax=Chitinimonas koreensis TaxID=356302 RepID=UPI000415F9F6|nr:DUF4399 domain-containing protein [Chitinimonas koreensis]QNM96845.1 DUF4399 domain-containing protein [Chitinimonas koreensis]